MRLYPAALVIIVLLSSTACSRQCSAEAAPGPGAATVAPQDPAQQDLASLQGTWRIDSSVWNGVREGDVVRSITIVFQGDKFIVVDKDGNRQEETIKLMPDQNPKAIDCSSKRDGLASPGIYSLEGDKFTWCSAGGDKKVRPPLFASKPGSKHSLMVLRRKKADNLLR